MKSIYKVLSLAALALASTSCGDDFLEVTSPTKISSDEYFGTAEHVSEAVVAAYDPLQWTDWGINEYAPYQLMGDIMGDDFWVGGSDANDNQNWHLMANYSATPLKVITSIWVEAFSGIKRCNDVLEDIERGVENATQAEINSWTAQVKVLRAFYTNWLWKFYGNIPYFERNLTSPYITPQMTADEVYNYMVGDIESALALNALPWKATVDTYGRVTTAMAYMLYA